MNGTNARTWTLTLAGLAILSQGQAAPANQPEAPDPLIEILALRLSGRAEEAAEAGESARDRWADRSTALGLDLALAASYEQAGRLHDAFNAWQRALDSPTPLFARFAAERVAALHLELGRPESAALVARRAIADNPPWTNELVTTLANAAGSSRDCAALAIKPTWSLERSERRRLTLAAARCDLDLHTGESVDRLTSLLLDDQLDLVASEAAILLYPHRHRLSDAARRALAEALHHHRLFDRSTQVLTEILDEKGDSEDLYKLARGQFWLGNHATAADEFQRVASLAPGANSIARGWFQRGRSLELAGEAEAARVAFRRANDANSTGPWASASLLSALRLEALAGSEEEARRLYGLLASRASWRGLADRAALFLASSDIVRGRTTHARGWLSRSTAPEFSYWKGRLAELEGLHDEALEHYLRLAVDIDDPLSLWARVRLRGNLAEVAEARGRRLADSPRLSDLRAATLLLGDDDLAEVLAAIDAVASERLGGLGRVEPMPVSAWPLWTQKLNDEERLLRLGVMADDADVRRRFPLDDTALALAGIDLLYLNGRHRDGARIAEVLAKRLRPRLTAAQGVTPVWLGRRLFPRPYLDSITEAADRFDIDPNLLLGLIRQESRFDPGAVSEVSARGLTQFVVATADEAARAAGIEDLTPPMLHRPEIAIALGAAHLRHLLDELDGSSTAVLAAYNAGLPQARVWAGYCFSDDPAEYYSKIGFSQTRDYVAKVLANRNRYRALYGESDE